MSEDLGFSFQRRKDGSIEILHQGRLASTLRGHDAEAFMAEMEGQRQAELQQLMARLTDNYKRGNEHSAKGHPRNAD